MRTRQLLERAREQVAEMTGNPVEAVSGFHRDDGGVWVVTVEVLELERVPNTMDLLATYAVTLTERDDAVGVQRRRRYHRAAVEGTRTR